MATWSVSPNDGNFSINGDQITFYPNNTSTDRHYVVTGTENGCTASRDMTVYGTNPDPSPCMLVTTDSSYVTVDKYGEFIHGEDCDSVYFYKGNVGYIYSPASAEDWCHISIHWQSDSDWGSWTCTNYQSNPEVAYKLEDQLNLPHNENDPNLGAVHYRIDPNTDGSDRQCTLKFSINGEECDIQFNIYQEGGGGPQPPTGSCSQLLVEMSLLCNSSTGRRYIQYYVSNWYAECSSMVFSTDIRYTHTDGSTKTYNVGQITFTGNGTYNSVEFTASMDETRLTAVATSTWLGDFNVKFTNSVGIPSCGSHSPVYTLKVTNDTSYNLNNIVVGIQTTDTTFSFPSFNLSSHDYEYSDFNRGWVGNITNVDMITFRLPDESSGGRLRASCYTVDDKGSNNIYITITCVTRD